MHVKKMPGCKKKKCFFSCVRSSAQLLKKAKGQIKHPFRFASCRGALAMIFARVCTVNRLSDLLWRYNNAPGVFAFHTQEHADKDKHTHKQMLAGKHR